MLFRSNKAALITCAEDFVKAMGWEQDNQVKEARAKGISPLPNELDVKDKIRQIVEEDDEAINIAIKLCLYCMKTQIFLDGNKRASVIFANHYLISHGGGFLVIPEKEVPEFKRLLVKYYEGNDLKVIADFMKEHCWKTI